MRVVPLWIVLGLAACDGADDAESGTADSGEAAPVGTLAGSICMPSGQPAFGATVFVETGGERLSTTTSAEGNFVLEGVPAGPQVLRAERETLFSTHEVTVVADTVTFVEGMSCLQWPDSTATLGRVLWLAGQFDDASPTMEALTAQGRVTEVVEVVAESGDDWHDLLLTPGELEGYDTIVATGGVDFAGLEPRWADVGSNLSDWVNGGGRLITTDWAYFLAEVAAPDANDFVGDDAVNGSAHAGVEGRYEATLVEPVLASRFESPSVFVEYPSDIWVPLVSAPVENHLLTATFEYYGNGFGTTLLERTGPLATRARIGEGSVVFTSFYHHDDMSSDERRLIYEVYLLP